MSNPNQNRETEIDVFMRRAQLDPQHTRFQNRIDPVRSYAAIELKQFNQFENICLLLFNEAAPAERLSMLCGMSVEYWQSIFRRKAIPKTAMGPLVMGLRAHISGVRDHLRDTEDEITRLTSSVCDLRDARARQRQLSRHNSKRASRPRSA